MTTQNRNLPLVITPQPLPEDFKFTTPYGNDYYQTRAIIAKTLAIAIAGCLPGEWLSHPEES